MRSIQPQADRRKGRTKSPVGATIAPADPERIGEQNEKDGNEMTKTEHIRLPETKGTWYKIDEFMTNDNIEWWLLESEQVGDECAWLVVAYACFDGKGKYDGPIFTTYDGIETCLEDEGII